MTNKGRLSKQKMMEDNSQAKHIALLIISLNFLVLNIDDFRRHETRSSASRIDILFSITKFSKSEITNNTLYILILIVSKYYILGF
jgi:hypothetical protein